jgi:hypothetical protein
LPYDVGSIVGPILQVRILKFREIK